MIFTVTFAKQANIYWDCRQGERRINAFNNYLLRTIDGYIRSSFFTIKPIQKLFEVICGYIIIK